MNEFDYQKALTESKVYKEETTKLKLTYQHLTSKEEEYKHRINSIKKSLEVKS